LNKKIFDILSHLVYINKQCIELGFLAWEGQSPKGRVVGGDLLFSFEHAWLGRSFFPRRGSMDESKIERRACVRFKIPGATVSYQKKSLFFTKPGFIEEFCPLLDISRGGVRFLAQNSLKPNTEVQLKISIPGERIPFTMKGAVKWASPAEGKTFKYQVGVQFHPYGEAKDQNLPANLVKIIALEQKFIDKEEGGEPPDSNKDEFQI